MSWVDIFSYWRCPNCDQENRYNLTWQHFYEFKEIHGEFSKETCEYCGRQYYVSSSEPNPLCFRMNRGRCKNDYVKDLVLDIESESLTVINEYHTI